MKDMTTLKVRQETWRRLNKRKKSSDQTFDGIINDLLDEADSDG